MKLKMMLAVTLVLCLSSIAFADYSVRPFHGTYKWWGSSEGIVQIDGSVNFRLNDFGPAFGGIWLGFEGKTSDGRLYFEENYYEPGEIIVIEEQYSSPLGSFIGFSAMLGLYPEIFVYNDPFVIYREIFNVPELSAELTLYVDPAPVPEPATMMLLGLGLAGAVFARRRLKK